MATKLSDYRPYRFVKLPAPVVVTEAGGDTLLISLSDTLSAGTYNITVSLVAAFANANDQLSWFVEGSTPSPRFLLEAKDAAEDLPIAYNFPYEHLGGVLSLDLSVAIVGAGAASVTIQSANIIFDKKGE